MIPFLLVIVVIALALGATATPPATKPRHLEPEDPMALVERDPVEALRLYGTPETADQLRAQGIDLAALGYRGGGEA